MLSVCWRYPSHSLCSLLIKILCPLGDFDGEEGLHAGVQVEGFTGPAGANRSGVGMVEAVHRSQPIAGLLASA